MEKRTKRSDPNFSFFFSQRKNSYRRRNRRKEGFRGGINITDFVKIKDDGHGVLKETVEKYARRERAAYLIDRFLGFNFVPPTVLKGRGKVLQEFVHDAETAWTYKKKQEEEPSVNRPPIPNVQLLKPKIFDFLIKGWDRHENNFLIKKGEIFAIDNERSLDFDECYDPSEHTYEIKEYAKLAKIPEEVVKNLKKFYSWKEGQDLLRVLLEELIDKKIVQIFLKQLLLFIEAINEDGALDDEKIKNLSKHYFDKYEIY